MGLIRAIRGWLSHTTMIWVKLEDTLTIDNPAIFDKALSDDEITNLYVSSNTIPDPTWHFVVIIFRRFGRQEYYLDGKQIFSY